MSARSKPPLGAQLRAALAEVDRLQAEVVRLQARLELLEAAAVPAAPRRRGLASLIDTGAATG
jgi:hypothetical protein